MLVEPLVREYLAIKASRSINSRRLFHSVLLSIFAKRFKVLPDIVQLSELVNCNSWSQNTRATVYSILAPFYNYLYIRYKVENILVLLDRPKVEIKPVPTLTVPEINGLLSAPWRKQWHRTAILLILDTTLRVGEIMGLKWDDIDWKANAIWTKGKTGHYWNPVNPKVLALIRELPRTSERVFPYTGNALRYALMRRLQWLSIRKSQMGPHLLRHTAITQMLYNGCPTRMLQQFSHHRNLRNLERYTSCLQQEEIIAAHQRYSLVKGLGVLCSANTRSEH